MDEAYSCIPERTEVSFSASRLAKRSQRGRGVPSLWMILLLSGMRVKTNWFI